MRPELPRLQLTTSYVLFQYLTRRTVLSDYQTRRLAAGARAPQKPLQRGAYAAAPRRGPVFAEFRASRVGRGRVKCRGRVRG